MILDRRGLTLIELMVAMVIFLIIMGVLASFLINAAHGAATARRSAWNGQAVERALSLLRQELAGATAIERVNDSQLLYCRVRDDSVWIIMVEEGNLIRRNNVDPTQMVIMAKDVDSFEFILPRETYDEILGYMTSPKMLQVIVGAGNFKLDDSIYLRNIIN